MTPLRPSDQDAALDEAPREPAAPPKVHDPERPHHGFHGRRSQSPRPVKTKSKTRRSDKTSNLELNDISTPGERQGHHADSSKLAQALPKEVERQEPGLRVATDDEDAEEREGKEKMAASLKAEDVFSAYSSSSSANFSPKFHPLDLDSAASTIPSPFNQSIQLLELKVQAHLLPTTILLSQKPLTRAHIKQAKQSARSAYYLVRSSRQHTTRAGRALAGRCCFYVGVCRLASDPLRGSDHSAQQWFATALDAKGTYAEGDWAEDWMRKLQRVTCTVGTRMSPTAAESPRSAGSNVSGGGLWDLMASSVRSAVAAAQGAPAIARQDDDSPTSLGRLKPTRVPSFESWHTGDTGSEELSSRGGHAENHRDAPWSPDHILRNGDILPGPLIELEQRPNRTTGTHHNDTDDEEDNIPYNVHGGSIKISNLKTTPPPSNQHVSDTLVRSTVTTYEGESPSPATSPNTGRSPTRSRSVAFSALERLSGGGDSPSPTSVIFDGLLNRRKLSNAANALAIATGMKSADELGLAEEGQSPFKSTFGADVSKLRKRSTESRSPSDNSPEALDE